MLEDVIDSGKLKYLEARFMFLARAKNVEDPQKREHVMEKLKSEVGDFLEPKIFDRLMKIVSNKTKES